MLEPVGQHLAEPHLHERIEPGRGFVHHQELGPDHERGDERDLLPVSPRVGTALAGRIELEALAQLDAEPVVPAAGPR